MKTHFCRRYSNNKIKIRDDVYYLHNGRQKRLEALALKNDNYSTYTKNSRCGSDKTDK